MINKLYSILALLMFSGLVNAYTVYDNKDNWIAALPSPDFITEDFNDEFMKKPELDSYIVLEGTFTLEFQSNNLIPETSSQATFDTQAFIEKANEERTTVWNFSSPFIAFGGNWDLSPADPGTGLAIIINGTTQIDIIPSTYTGGFWGFVADVEDLPFLTVELLRPTGTTGSELYHLDDMVFAPVPLPAAIWLLVSGFIGLFGYKKRFSH